LHHSDAQNPHGMSTRPGDAGDGVAPPRVIAWEVTRSCNLACVHCRASALHGPYEGELSTGEAFSSSIRSPRSRAPSSSSPAATP